MQERTVDGHVLDLLAGVLDYPVGNPVGKVQECVALLSTRNPDAAASLSEFQAFAKDADQGTLEELYTVTFDLDAACHPYVGYHLFGESYMRSAFLTELKEHYRGGGFAASETELPDRLSTVLRFLSQNEDEDLKQELINEALLPALTKMLKESTNLSEEFQQELIDDGTFPVLGKAPTDAEDGDQKLHQEMTEAGFFPTLGNTPEDSEDSSHDLDRGSDPYRHVLRALRSVLENLSTQEPEQPDRR